MEQPMVGGTVISEPGFTPALDAKFEGTGNDYIRNDPDGKRMRLNAHGVVKTHDDAVSNIRWASSGASISADAT